MYCKVSSRHFVEEAVMPSSVLLEVRESYRGDHYALQPTTLTSVIGNAQQMEAGLRGQFCYLHGLHFCPQHTRYFGGNFS